MQEEGKRTRRFRLIIELGAINCSLCCCCCCCTFWMAAVAESRIAGLAQRIEVGSTLSSAASAAAAVAVAALLAHLQNEAEKNIAISFWLRLQLAFNLFAGEIAFSLPLKSRLKTVQVLVRECVRVCVCTLHCIACIFLCFTVRLSRNLIGFAGSCDCVGVSACLYVCLCVCALHMRNSYILLFYCTRFNCGPSEFNVCARK